MRTADRGLERYPRRPARAGGRGASRSPVRSACVRRSWRQFGSARTPGATCCCWPRHGWRRWPIAANDDLRLPMRGKLRSWTLPTRCSRLAMCPSRWRRRCLARLA